MQYRYGPRFRMLHDSVDQNMTAAVAKMGLTAAQGRIMGYLSRCKEPPCPRDLEEHFQLSHPTVSGLLNRLSKKEFIALVPDPADKRCKRIHVLPRGEACQRQLRETIDAIERQIVNGFSSEEQAQFFALLDRAAANMKQEECSV